MAKQLALRISAQESWELTLVEQGIREHGLDIHLQRQTAFVLYVGDCFGFDWECC